MAIRQKYPVDFNLHLMKNNLVSFILANEVFDKRGSLFNSSRIMKEEFDLQYSNLE